jgi:hypothetical protein
VRSGCRRFRGGSAGGTFAALERADPVAIAPKSQGPSQPSHTRLLDDSGRAGVWPDSVQVIGGELFIGLPTPDWVWLAIGLRRVDHRDEAWLKKGLPSS